MAATLLVLITYMAMLLVNKLTQLFLTLIRKLLVFALITTALNYFLSNWYQKMVSEPSPSIILIGLVGVLAGAASFYIAFYSLIESTKHMKEKKALEAEKREEERLQELRETKQEVEGIREMLSLQMLKDDKSLGAVLAYMAIAQFGVFSSKTISAPNIQTGIIVFILFIAVTGFFIKIAYKNYLLGVKHFLIALTLGFLLSVLLGAAWGGESPTDLISPYYFQTESLVALMTGIAIPIFMGSKK